MKKRNKAEAPTAQQESLFLWIDPATIDPTRWSYGARLPRDRWDFVGGLRLALRDRRVIAWTVQLDDGSQVELHCAATLLRREIRELGRRGEIHVRLIDAHTLQIATRNRLAERGGVVMIRDGNGLASGQAAEDDPRATLRLLVERPQSEAEQTEWCERMALYKGLREPLPRPRNRRYPSRSRGPRSRQLALKVFHNNGGDE